MPELQTVTHSKLRKDAWGKVTGKTHYVDDLPLENALYGAVVRSPHHHARILSIETRQAEDIEGVIAVLTADDIPGSPTFGPIIQDRYVLAFNTVRHIGEPIVLVIAENKLTASRGVKAVIIKYEKLTPVFDPLDALKPDAPKVHSGGNLVTEYNLGCGDIEAGFAEADVLLEETFQVQRVSPGYLEPEVAAAAYQNDVTLTVWVSSQKPFVDRHAISQVLNVPEEKVRVLVPAIGGAFGGKEDSGLPILAALSAWITKRTVRFVNSREESIQAHPKRHPAVLRWKMGANLDGKVVALRTEAYMDTGAYASYGPAVAGVLSEAASGPYRIPHVRITCKLAYTNSPFSGAMRGFGAPQALFATDSMMDMMATRLGMDPITFRRKNVLQHGDRTTLGVLIKEPPTLKDCLDMGAKARSRLSKIPTTPGKLSGVGIAINAQAMGLGYGVSDDCTNRIEWLLDGRVRLDIGTPDMGQGTVTVAAQMAAEALGVPFESVEVAELDTDISPNGGVTCASRMTYIVGNATLLAAHKAVDGLLAEVARILDLPQETLVYRQGQIYLGTIDEVGITIPEITARAAEDGRKITGEATFTFPYPPDVTPHNLPIGMPHIMFGYCAHVARVEVDPDFGTVDAKEIVAIHDVGRAINPVGVEGQIEGGVSMGVGYAIQEEVKLKTDLKWTDSFTEYLLPTTLDMPVVTSVILEQPEPSGPFGAKGVGEMASTPVAPAIANAIADATGKRITSLPIKPALLINNEETDFLEVQGNG